MKIPSATSAQAACSLPAAPRPTPALGTPWSPPARPPAASCPGPRQSLWPGLGWDPGQPHGPQGPRHRGLLLGCSCPLVAVPGPSPPRLTATEKVDSCKRRSQGRRSHLIIPSGHSISFPLPLRQAGSSLAPALQPPPALCPPPPRSGVIHVSPKVAQQSPL